MENIEGITSDSLTEEAAETINDISADENAEDKGGDWMEELKENLNALTETVKKGAAGKPAPKAETQEDEENSAPSRSKDELAKELEDMKSG